MLVITFLFIRLPAPSATKINRQTYGRFVKIRPTVGLSATGSWWRRTREKPMVSEMGRLDRVLDRARSMALGRSVMKRIRIGRRKIRNERPWLEELAPDLRDPDIVRAKALARAAPSRKAPGK